MAASLNGLVLQGSVIPLQFHPQWMRSANLLFELAVNASGTEFAFPIWGTCMGFEILGILAAGGNTSVVTQNAFDSED